MNRYKRKNKELRYHWRKRRLQRDEFLYMIYQGSGFERLNPEE
jgi:hypothetical protein